MVKDYQHSSCSSLQVKCQLEIFFCPFMYYKFLNKKRSSTSCPYKERGFHWGSDYDQLARKLFSVSGSRT